MDDDQRAGIIGALQLLLHDKEDLTKQKLIYDAFPESKFLFRATHGTVTDIRGDMEVCASVAKELAHSLDEQSPLGALAARNLVERANYLCRVMKSLDNRLFGPKR
jgi:hypothetical protein